METFVLPGRKTDRFLLISIRKNLGSFESGKKNIKVSHPSQLI